MVSKLLRNQETLENVGWEAHREKTTVKLKHIDLAAIWGSFWLHLGVLGRALDAFLGVLGQLEPT